MPTVAYSNDSDDETEIYASLLFSEIIHQQIVEDVEEGHEEEVEQTLDFLYVNLIILQVLLTTELDIDFESFQISHRKCSTHEKIGKRSADIVGGFCQEQREDACNERGK